MSILIFGTLPAKLNTNGLIARHVANATRRVLPRLEVIESSVTAAAALIDARRPMLAIGIGSAAMGSVSFEEIAYAAKRVNAPLVYWLHDDPYEFDYSWRLNGLADWIFTNDKTSLFHYGTEFVSHLPLAASLDDHFRSFIPIALRPINIFFCGYAYPNRNMVVYRLRHLLRQWSALILGDGWDPSLEFCVNRRLTAEEISEHYSISKLTLNIGRVFNIANQQYEIVPSTPGPRTFEAAAAGALQCCFVDSTEIFEYFEEEKEILTFSSVQDLSTIITQIIAHPDKFSAIASASQQRVRRDHTYDRRVETILSVLKTQTIADLDAFRDIESLNVDMGN
jgi:spore maturation protein CgeB